MILCNYLNDFGHNFRAIRPTIVGKNLLDNQFIPPNECVSIISNYVSTDRYYEVSNKAGYCQLTGRARKLIYQNSEYLIEAEYPEPPDIDWTIINQENIKIEIIPEFINHSNAKLILKL